MTDKLPTADEARKLTQKHIADQATKLLTPITDLINQAAAKKKYEASIKLDGDNFCTVDYLEELLESVGFKVTVSFTGKGTPTSSTLTFNWKPEKK